MEAKKYYNGINGLRCIAAIGIVMMHVKENLTFEFNNIWIDNCISRMGAFVQLFFVISAFSMCCGYYEKIKDRSLSLNDFYKRRIEKILPFFGTIVLAEMIFSKFSAEALWEGIADLTLLFGFLPNSKISIVGVGWALGVIFVFYWLFPAFVFAMDNKKRAWIMLIISVFFYFANTRYFLVNGEAAFCNILIWSSYFVAGGLIYLYRNEIERIPKVFRYCTLILVILLSIYLFVGSINFLTEYILKITVFSIWVICAIWFDGKVLCNKFTSFFSNVSFEIYLCHMVVFKILNEIGLSKIFSNDLVNYVFDLAVVIVGAVMAAFAFKYVYRCVKRKI